MYVPCVFNYSRKMYMYIYLEGSCSNVAVMSRIQQFSKRKKCLGNEHLISRRLNFFFGLSFLDHEEFEECFVLDVFFEAPESEKAIEFAYYVVNNYIDQSPLQITVVLYGLNLR
jgi:hypothetical protein